MKKRCDYLQPVLEMFTKPLINQFQCLEPQFSCSNVSRKTIAAQCCDSGVFRGAERHLLMGLHLIHRNTLLGKKRRKFER